MWLLGVMVLTTESIGKGRFQRFSFKRKFSFKKEKKKEERIVVD